MEGDWNDRRVRDLRVLSIYHGNGSVYRRIVLAETVSSALPTIERFYREPEQLSNGELAPRPTHATVAPLTIMNAGGWVHLPPDEVSARTAREQVVWASPEQKAKWRAEVENANAGAERAEEAGTVTAPKRN